MTGVRSFLAGTGASGSLLVAAFIASLAVTALLGFEGMPSGDGEADARVIPLDQPDASTASAAVAAGNAVGGAASSAVAASPAPGTGSGDGALLADATGAIAGVGGSGGIPKAVGNPPSANDPTLSPTCDGPGAPPCERDPVGELIEKGEGTVDETVGVRPAIGETIKPVRDAVDGVLKDTTGSTLGGHVDGLLGGK